MIDAQSFLSSCSVTYKVKFQQETKITYKSEYDVLFQAEKVSVYETVSPFFIICSFSGNNFPFAAAVAVATQHNYKKIELAYLDRLKVRELKPELKDLTCYYNVNEIDFSSELKEKILKDHRKRGYETTVISVSELEKIAETFLNSVDAEE